MSATLLLARSETPHKQKARDLALNLQAKRMVDGVPQEFTFNLTNTGAREIRLPIPAIQCFYHETGTISLTVRFTPQSGTYLAGSGHGCGGGVFDGPGILERAKTWKVLRPGESLTVAASRELLFYDDRQPGRYDFWAIYFPPVITSQDWKILERAGVNLAVVGTTSAHLIFVKRH